MALHLTPEVGSLTLGITVPGANCSTLAQTAGNGRNLIMTRTVSNTILTCCRCCRCGTAR